MKLVENGRDIHPEEFGQRWFFRMNVELIDRYATLRVKGFPSGASFRRVFGSSLESVREYDFERAAQCIELSHHYAERFEEIANTIPIEDLWNERTSLELLVTIANADLTKSNARVKLEAARDLDALTGCKKQVDKLLAGFRKV
jgi:hypothetical protein